MTKPIEERVKNIVENDNFLTLKNKSEIICLIECYKGADQLVQKYYKLLDGTITALDNLKRLVNNELDYIPSQTDIVGDLTATIEYLKKGLL